jgi:predicted DNA-binding transcriptional regulator YafY
MPNKLNQKIKLLKLFDLLKENTDEENPMSTNSIVTKLNKLGISSERKTLYEDIKLLNDNGYEVLCYKSNCNKYYVSDRKFNVAELKTLIDAIQSASFITEKKTNEFIDKIAKLGGNNRAEILKNNIICFNTTKQCNEEIFYNISAIDEAIVEKKKISFLYFDYDLKGNKVYRKEANRYFVNPLTLVLNDSNYYLICYSDKYDNLSNYRVDRMQKVEKEKENVTEASWLKNINLSEYKKQSFSMYSGEETEIVIKFDNSMLDIIFDKFGKNLNIKSTNDNKYIAKVKIQTSPVFYSWCCTFGSKLIITSPENIIKGLKNFVNDVLINYK